MHCPVCNTSLSPSAEECPNCGAHLEDRTKQMKPSRDPNGVVSEEQRVLTASLAGEYEIVDLIGEGTTGAVFKVNHLRLSRAFAVKVLKFSFAQQEKIVRRFLNEAQVAARLRHPNIVNIIDVKQEKNLNYFIMDYIGEQNLEALIETQERLSVRQALDYALDICDALEHAHAHNVVHRDIKPSNIVMAADGRPVLTDFSIAKISQEGSEAGLTVIGTIMGTYWYMSPEQFRASGSVDSRSDIYSFGALLYEMATGCRPFTGETLPELTRSHLHQIPMAPSELAPDIPEALDKIILKCLEKSQSLRYQTAEQLKTDLRECRRTAEELSVPKPPSKSCLDHMEAGRQALERGEFQRASMALNNVPQSDPDYPEAMMLLEQVNSKLKAQEDSADALSEGKAAMERGQIDLAIKYLSRSLAYDAANKRARETLAEAKRRRDQRLEIGSLINKARNALEDHDNELVIAVCDHVLGIDSEQSEALFLKSTARNALLIEEKKKELFAQANERRNRGELDGALNTIRQIKELDPSSTIAHNLEQEFLKENERQKRIQEHLRMAKEQALREDYEGEVETWGVLINIAPERSEEFVANKERAEEASKKKKRIDMLLFAASECLEKEFWGKAIKICEEIIKIDSGHLQAQSILEQSHGRLDKDRKARLLVESIEKAIAGRRFKEARDELSQLFRINPNHAKYSVLEEQLRESLLRVERIRESLRLIQRGAEDADMSAIGEGLDKLEMDLDHGDPEYQLHRLMARRIAQINIYFQEFMGAVAALSMGNLEQAAAVLEASLNEASSPPAPPPADPAERIVPEEPLAGDRLTDALCAGPTSEMPLWMHPAPVVDLEDDDADDEPLPAASVRRLHSPQSEMTEQLEDDVIVSEATSEEPLEEYTEELEPEFATAPTTVPSPVYRDELDSTDVVEAPVAAPSRASSADGAPKSALAKLLTSSAMTFILIGLLLTFIVIIFAAN